MVLSPKHASGPDAPTPRGLICPRCLAELPGNETPKGEVARCQEDGYAFVRASALDEAGRDPFLGKTIAGRYVLLGRLGAGSMGTVYWARQEAMDRDVAVKILHADRLSDTRAKARFVREARAMSLLASAHTVAVLDFGEIRSSEESSLERLSLPAIPLPTEPDVESDGGGMSLYLAMEMLEGESLGERLRRSPRLDPREAVKIARHALLSLADAHDKGVIHRDLKPDNLFLAKTAGESGETFEVCKVLDFGIAKVLSDPRRVIDALETQEGTVFGTPRYMSPEQAQGRALDARSDLYSLGALLYQMVVGRTPFVDDDAVVVMAHHIKTAPVAPVLAAPDAGIARPLSDLIVRALSKDPAMRPPSAQAFIEELHRSIEEPPVTAVRGGLEPRRIASLPPSTSAGGRGPRPALVVVGALTVGILGGALAFGLTSSPPPRRLTATRLSPLSSSAQELKGLASRLQSAAGMADAADEALEFVRDDAIAKSDQERPEGVPEGIVLQGFAGEPPNAEGAGSTARPPRHPDRDAGAPPAPAARTRPRMRFE